MSKHWLAEDGKKTINKRSSIGSGAPERDHYHTFQGAMWCHKGMGHVVLFNSCETLLRVGQLKQ